MKNILFLFVILLSLFSCTEEEKKDCTDVICTLEYVTLMVNVTDSMDQGVVLDQYTVTNLGTGNVVSLTNLLGDVENGLYPLIADNMLTVGAEQELLFQGYIKHQEVVRGSFLVEQDCCHIGLISGDLDLKVTEQDTDCDQISVVDQDLYTNAPSDLATINNVSIANDCLTINFGASGCDGSSWELKLIDSEQVLESFPVQRNLRLSLKNNEECDAYFTKDLSFDISNLQLDNYNKILLNIDGYNQQVEYNY